MIEQKIRQVMLICHDYHDLFYERSPLYQSEREGVVFTYFYSERKSMQAQTIESICCVKIPHKIVTKGKNPWQDYLPKITLHILCDSFMGNTE